MVKTIGMMNTILLSALLWVNTFHARAPVTLHVEITNVKKARGKLLIAIYKPNEKFGEGTAFLAAMVDVKATGGQTASFEMEPGRYALAVYHDVNGNEELDKNFVGIPKEPYGFSKDFRPQFSAPSFKDCAFEVTGESLQKISVKLTD